MSGTLRLGDLAEIRISNVDKRTVSGETPVRLCNYVDVFGNRLLADNAAFMAASASSTEITKFQLQHGDLAITKDSETAVEIGIPAMVEYPGSDLVLGYHLALIRPSPTKADPYFLLAALQAAPVRRHFRRSATGVTRFGLSLRAIHDTPIPGLSLETQQRVGRWYRAASQEIAATEDLLRAQSARRRCLHRELVLGQRRFEAFGTPGDGIRPPPGWILCRLGDIAEIRISSVDKKTREGEQAVRLCNYLDVWRNDYIDDPMPFMAATATDSQISSLQLAANDVLLTKDSETREDIASSAVVRSISHGVVLGYHLALVRPDICKALGGFVANQLQAPKFRLHFIRSATGATRYGLSLKTLRDAPVWLPSMAEQEAIFATLEQCDREVELMRQRLDVLESHRSQTIEALCGNGVTQSRTCVSTSRGPL
jgi:type I restriction enzyme S subunit